MKKALALFAMTVALMFGTTVAAQATTTPPPAGKHCSDVWCKTDQVLDCQVHPLKPVEAATVPHTVRVSGDNTCNHTPTESEHTAWYVQRLYGSTWVVMGEKHSYVRSTWVWGTASGECVTGWYRGLMTSTARDVRAVTDYDSATTASVYITC